MAGKENPPTDDKPTIQRDASRGGKAIQQRGKGKALNALAAASGRDPAAIAAAAKSSAEKAAQAEAEAAAAAEAEAHAKAIAEAEAEAEKLNAAAANAKEEEDNQTQIYNSLSPQEQYRFECFRRCGFPSKSIEKFVAKMMVEEAQRRYAGRRGAVMGLGGSFDGAVSGAGAKAADESGVLGKSMNSSASNTVTDVSSTSDGEASLNKKLNKRKHKSKKNLLKEESKRRRAAMDQPLPYTFGGSCTKNNGGGGSNTGTGENCVPPLEHLVVPNSASEIVAVVSTLAKCYGQRLVAAARRVADAEEEAERLERSHSELLTNENADNVTTDSKVASSTQSIAPKMPSTPKPLLPHHFREAHRHRVQAGIDPGFWMADRPSGRDTRKPGGVLAAAALGSVDRNHTGYLAALAAQDAYTDHVEKLRKDEEEQQKEQKMNNCAHEASKNESKMEVDEIFEKPTGSINNAESSVPA